MNDVMGQRAIITVEQVQLRDAIAARQTPTGWWVQRLRSMNAFDAMGCRHDERS
jgi:hypothetical protein